MDFFASEVEKYTLSAQELKLSEGELKRLLHKNRVQRAMQYLDHIRKGYLIFIPYLQESLEKGVTLEEIDLAKDVWEKLKKKFAQHP